MSESGDRTEKRTLGPATLDVQIHAVDGSDATEVDVELVDLEASPTCVGLPAMDISD